MWAAAGPAVQRQAVDVAIRAAIQTGALSYAAYKASKGMPIYRTVSNPAKRAKRQASVRARNQVMFKNQFRFQGIHNFKRSIQFNCPYIPNTGFQWATTSAFGFSLATSLSQIGKAGGGANTTAAFSGSAELTALFDQYRIMGMTITMFFTANSSESSTAAGLTQSLPCILYAEDNSDITVPASANSLCEYANLKSFQFGGGVNKLIIKIKPRALMTSNNGNQVTSANQWFTTNNATQEFYGIKFYSPQSGTAATATGNLIVIIDQYMQFRDIQ